MTTVLRLRLQFAAASDLWQGFLLLKIVQLHVLRQEIGFHTGL